MVAPPPYRRRRNLFMDMLITENKLKSSSLRSSLMQCPIYLYLVTLVNNTLFNSIQSLVYEYLGVN